MVKTQTFSKRTAVASSAMSGSEDTRCSLSLWCLQCCCWHSTGCRASSVCLQHDATVVTSNGVTICGSQFPPTVSKHCQHQHSAIHKTIPAVCSTNNPSSCDIQGAAFSIQYHGSVCSQPLQSLSDVSPGLPKYKHNITKLNFYSVRPLPADPLTLLPKISNY